MERRWAWGVATTACVAVMVAVVALAAVSLSRGVPAAPAPPRDAACLACHGPGGSNPVGALSETQHGVAADPRTPGCSDCHGDTAGHLADPIGARTTILFGRKSPTPVATRNDACLTCHKGGDLIPWAGSPHEGADLACTSCHKVHERPRVRFSKADTNAQCVSCHRRQRVQMTRPVHHPMAEGRMACTDCHKPHGSAGPALLARDTVNGTCFQCHAEKRGPFIWNHQPVTENCALCHEPHGTVTAAMLKWRQPFLCQQCHEPTSHRGAIPSLTVPGTTTNMGVTLGRGCTNCHTNIHGSNNPTNSSGARSFRR